MHSSEDNLEQLKLTQDLLAKLNKDKISTEKELASVVEELAIQIKKKEEKVKELDELNQSLRHQVELTERNARKLEVAIKELESFSYSVSHDLRTPLRAIHGFTRILLEDYFEDLPEESKFYFEEIVRNTTKMGELIDNLLEFSRIAQKSVTKETVDTKSLVKDIIKELKLIEPERKIEFIVKELFPVQGDKNMLKQVFYNLLQNAHKYTGKKEKPVIEIGAKKSGKSVVTYVKDNGAGYDEKYADKLFGAFQRLHSNEEFEGTGIGLAIVEKIIKKHGGEIWSNSKIGEGATFYVSLPEK